VNGPCNFKTYNGVVKILDTLFSYKNRIGLLGSGQVSGVLFQVSIRISVVIIAIFPLQRHVFRGGRSGSSTLDQIGL